MIYGILFTIYIVVFAGILGYAGFSSEDDFECICILIFGAFIWPFIFIGGLIFGIVAAPYFVGKALNKRKNNKNQ